MHCKKFRMVGGGYCNSSYIWIFVMNRETGYIKTVHFCVFDMFVALHCTGKEKYKTTFQDRREKSVELSNQLRWRLLL